MEFTPAGLIYFVFIVWILIRRRDLFDNLFLLGLVVNVFVRMGYVVAIGDRFVNFVDVAQLILIIYSLAYFPKCSNKTMECWLLFASSYIIPIILLLAFPSQALVATYDVMWDDILFGNENLTHPKVTTFVYFSSLRYILFSIVFLYIYKKWNVKNYEALVSKFVRWSRLFLSIGIIEFVVKNIMGLHREWGSLLLWIFGEREMTVYEPRLRGDTFELNLFTQEASHYAYTLTIVCIASFANNIVTGKKRKIDYTILCTLLLMLFSTSFSIAYLLPALVCYYLLYRWYVLKPKSVTLEKMILGGFVCIFGGTIMALLTSDNDSFVGHRLANFYENMGDFLSITPNLTHSSLGDNSTQVRMLSTVQAIVAFFGRPVFGYSLMTIHSHAAFPSFLAGVGMYGLICWICFFFYCCPLYQKVKPQKLSYAVSIILLLFMNLLGGDRGTFSGTMLALFVTCFIFIYSNPIAEHLISNRNKSKI